MNDETEPSDPMSKDRRPLKTRSWPIFQTIAAKLAAASVSPNSISVASIVFAILGAIGFVMTGWNGDGILTRCGWLLAIAGMQLRLVANLLDGMVAVEGGKGSATGPLYNEVPDRISDAIFLIAAGYAYSSSPVAGWTATVLALIVAYIRAIAASLGAGQLFLGPMAKPHRMALLTSICTVALVLPSSWLIVEVSGRKVGLVEIALWIMVIGCVITVIRRLQAAAVYLTTHGK